MTRYGHALFFFPPSLLPPILISWSVSNGTAFYIVVLKLLCLSERETFLWSALSFLPPIEGRFVAFASL